MKVQDGLFEGCTFKEMCFITSYVQDCNARRAAEQSGHDPDDAYKMLDKPAIRTALDRVLAERAHRVGINADWLIEELIDNHRLARHAGNLGASNAALVSLGKMAKIDAFVGSKVDHTSSDGSMTPKTVEYTPAQLRAAAVLLERDI